MLQKLTRSEMFFMCTSTQTHIFTQETEGKMLQRIRNQRSASVLLEDIILALKNEQAPICLC